MTSLIVDSSGSVLIFEITDFGMFRNLNVGDVPTLEWKENDFIIKAAHEIFSGLFLLNH